MTTLPSTYRAWQIFGAGFENVGKDSQSSELELRPPAENEICIRIDACGICLSDIKIIRQGNEHARLKGIDLAVNPTVLGHECSATIVAIGDRWKDRFQIGQRCVVQADIYYQGKNYAFGYRIPGGMAEYAFLDERALEGDEGCYLIPVKPETGLSQAALTEPWACVEMSYNVEERLSPGGNRLLLVGDDVQKLKEDYPVAEVMGIDLDGLGEEDLYDDIIVAQAHSGLVDKLCKHIAPNGRLFILGPCLEDGPVTLDIGAIHYENKRIFGGADTLEDLAELHQRTELLPGGASLMIGSGGPMGQMHVQRALELPEPPRIVVVTDHHQSRLDQLHALFDGLAQERGVELVTIMPEHFGGVEGMNAHIASLAPEGYSDIVIMVPKPELVTDYAPYASDGAFINIFAGVLIGLTAPLPLKDLCRGLRLVGTSGSRIADMAKVLAKVENGSLNTNRTVAAIGGLDAVKDGLQAVKESRFHGKAVIYPQIAHFPLTPVEELTTVAPDLAALLDEEGAWTIAAEQALLATHGKQEAAQ